jgi:hypothetical protein
MYFFKEISYNHNYPNDTTILVFFKLLKENVPIVDQSTLKQTQEEKNQQKTMLLV